MFKELELPHIRAANPSSPTFIGLYLSHIFKRLESSVHAFSRSLTNLSNTENRFKENIVKFGLKRAIEIQWHGDQKLDEITIKHLDSENFEFDDIPETEISGSRLLIIDKNGNQSMLNERQVLDAINFDLSQISKFLTLHMSSLQSGPFQYKNDPKIHNLKSIIKQHPEQKILIFSQYVDTVEYIFENLKSDFSNVDWIVGSTKLNQRLSTRSRSSKISMFAPLANNYNGPDTIQILVASDTISEGVNLQDCSLVINYDLPWNPTRLIQRLGRVDRIGSTVQSTAINLLPDPVFAASLGLLQRVAGKIAIQSAVIGFENPLLTNLDPINPKIIGESTIQEIDKSFQKLRNSREYRDYELASQNTLLKFAHEHDPSHKALSLQRLINNLGLNEKLKQLIAKPHTATIPYTIIDTCARKQFAFAVYLHKHKSSKLQLPIIFTSNKGKTCIVNSFDFFDLYKHPIGISILSLPDNLKHYVETEWRNIERKNSDLITKKNEGYSSGNIHVKITKPQQKLITEIHKVCFENLSQFNHVVDLDLAKKLHDWLTTMPIRNEHMDQFELFTSSTVDQAIKCGHVTLLKKIHVFQQKLCSKYPSYKITIPQKGDISSTLVCRGAFV
ncbi:MAG: C-terminal helicase domain-containing protein [Thaumarchaeota archaeon]|nr:C-terminal helicase domain-containing protein [Nitrososphaerota archaeon]